MEIIGIDPSSKKLAFCVASSSTPVFHKISLPEGVLHAAGAAFEEAFLFFQQFEPNKAKAYMEAPVVGRSVYSTIIQAQVGGAVLAAAAKAGMDLELVNVNSWKKQVVKKGNASKEEVAEWLEKNWPKAYNLADKDQDLIDAAALNRYGYQHARLAKAILSRSRNARKNQKEAVAA